MSYIVSTNVQRFSVLFSVFISGQGVDTMVVYLFAGIYMNVVYGEASPLNLAISNQ
jgi:hypothetical protein